MIRRQRELAELPMRQLAAMVGISNPYLSQIERGLREPSDQVLRSIAESLHMSADALAPADGSDHDAVDSEDGDEQARRAVIDAIRADRLLSARQRQALEESYAAFREVSRTRADRRSGRARAPKS
jgi:transcriptional regulator with XRE-family HTH domain